MFVHPAEPWPDRPPWRPFLSGPPRFQPGLRPIPDALWLRPDPEHAANMANRAAVLRHHPQAPLRADTESRAAQAEALRLIEAALGERAAESGAPDIARAGTLLADDLVIMERRAGEWRATALLLTAPTFFSADEAFGRDLFALHAPVPGNTPGDVGVGHRSVGLYARIGALFDRMPPDTAFQRFNWTLQCGAERHTPDGAAHRALAAALGPEKTAEILHLRVERQTVRRLPETGAVLFTIRVALDPLAVLAACDLAALGQAWRSADRTAGDYKRWDALGAAAEIAFARG